MYFYQRYTTSVVAAGIGVGVDGSRQAALGGVGDCVAVCAMGSPKATRYVPFLFSRSWRRPLESPKSESNFSFVQSSNAQPSDGDGSFVC